MLFGEQSRKTHIKSGLKKTLSLISDSIKECSEMYTANCATYDSHMFELNTCTTYVKHT